MRWAAGQEQWVEKFGEIVLFFFKKKLNSMGHSAPKRWSRTVLWVEKFGEIVFSFFKKKIKLTGESYPKALWPGSWLVQNVGGVCWSQQTKLNPTQQPQTPERIPFRLLLRQMTTGRRRSSH